MSNANATIAPSHNSKNGNNNNDNSSGSGSVVAFSCNNSNRNNNNRSAQKLFAANVRPLDLCIRFAARYSEGRIDQVLAAAANKATSNPGGFIKKALEEEWIFPAPRNPLSIPHKNKHLEECWQRVWNGWSTEEKERRLRSLKAQCPDIKWICSAVDKSLLTGEAPSTPILERLHRLGR